MVFLCSLGCPGTHFVALTDFELKDPPASASQVLGLKMCTTTDQLWSNLFVHCEDMSFPRHLLVALIKN